MTSRRNASEPESAGEIRLRQTAQVSAADQTRTFEIAVVLPTGASTEEIQRAIEGAEMGMRGLSEQMDRQISAFREEAVHGGNVIASLPPAVEPKAVAAPVAPPQAVPEAESEATTPAEPVATAEPAPEEASPEPTEAAAKPPKKMTSSEFYRAAKTLGYDAMGAQKALGVPSLADIDLVEALERLRELAAQPAAPPAPTPAPTRGFTEELRPGDEDGLPPPDMLDDLDEPDFAPVEDDLDGQDGEAEATKPDAAATRRRTDAERRLRALRALRGSGPPATPEQRQALANCFISPLGADFARDLVSAIWHPVPGERLNAARTRNLVEWSKEDDEFEETAALIFELARQPADEGEE
jgi:hypothetical protein